MANNEKIFSILVLGKEAAEVEEGDLNKSTGLPIGKVNKIKLRPGQVSIPNFSKVWGRKILDKKTEKPTGNIEFLEYGTKGGELIPIRYIEGCSSLDKHYQINVLKLDFSDEEDFINAYINLDAGINDFKNTEDNALFLDFLQHHTYCEDNKSRNPKKDVVFKLYNPQNINKMKIDSFKDRQKAAEYIMASENDEKKLAVLARLFEIDGDRQDAVIFGELFEILEDDYKRVINVIDINRARFKNILQDLADKGVLLVEEDDVISNIDGEREFLIKGIDSKDKIKHLVDEFLTLEVFEVYQKVSILKNQLLQKLA